MADAGFALVAGSPLGAAGGEVPAETPAGPLAVAAAVGSGGVGAAVGSSLADALVGPGLEAGLDHRAASAAAGSPDTPLDAPVAVPTERVLAAVRADQPVSER